MTPRENLRPNVRAAVFIRDKNTCVYCGSPANVVDHIKPVYDGGMNDIANLVAACSRCNTIANKWSFNSFDDKRIFILTTYLCSATHYSGLWDRKARAKRILKKLVKRGEINGTAEAVLRSVLIQSNYF